MATGTQTHTNASSDPEPDQAPAIAVCESRPGTAVFLEAENTDGWIASDLTVDVTR